MTAISRCCALLLLVVLSTLGHCCNAQQVTAENIQAVANFVRSHGGFIHPFLEPRFLGAAGWGLFFNGTEGEDDDGGLAQKRNPESRYRTLIRVPHSILMCNTTEDKDFDLETNVLIQFKTNFSFWEPFFNTMPKQVDLPWFWTQEEVDRLESPFITMHLSREKRDREQAFKTIEQTHPYLNATLEEFDLVHAWVLTRSFNIDNWHCLVPFADLPNHEDNSVESHWVWRQSTRTEGLQYFELRTDQRPIRGTEFTIAYHGDMPNDDFLTDYGFVNIDSRMEAVLFDYPGYVENVALKRNITEALHMEWMVEPISLLTFFRTLVATTDELNEVLPHLKSRPLHGHFSRPLSLRRELDAVEACVRELQKAKPRSALLHKEFQYKYDRSLSWRDKTILAFRISNDRLYQRASEFCERLAEHLRCSAPRRLHRMWGLRVEPVGLDDFMDRLYTGGDDALCRSMD